MLMSSMVVFSIIISLVVTIALRRYAVRRGMVDIPNHRSSHSRTTPRGGGVAIVITVLLGLLALFAAGRLGGTTLLAFSGAGLLVAIVGFADDHRHVAAGWRLLIHFAAAACVVTLLIPNHPPLVMIFCAVATVWLLNLYNFMDGIDGIASIEAVTVCTSMWVLAESIGIDSGSTDAWLLLAGASSGFLPMNFPKAHIFMGDAGSGFIGVLLGAFVVQTLAVSPELFYAWVIMLGSFVVDATVTLLQRLRRGKRLYEAHRSHAYQILARRFGGHVSVSLSVGLINIAWLLPIAGLGLHTSVSPLLAIALAWLPLTALAFFAGAGSVDD